MTAKEARKRLVGRRITGVRLFPFGDGRGGKATDPVLYLDDGTEVGFVVQETEVGEYGIALCTSAPNRKGKP